MCKHDFTLECFVQKIVKGEFVQYAVQRCKICGKLFYYEESREDIYEIRGVRNG
jgi:hypothetical protein